MFSTSCSLTLLVSALCFWSQCEVDGWSQERNAAKDRKELPACIEALFNRDIHARYAFL